jgi:predicted transposase YbfD/YdcC
MPSPELTDLFTPYFENLTDPRLQRSQRHALLDIVIIALCATLANADGWVDIERFGKAKLSFFRRFLDLPNGIPSHDTFGRVFAKLNPGSFLTCVQHWLASFQASAGGQHVAIDGKTLRGSFDSAAKQNPLHLVSAWACETRLLLGQVAVDQKSNEITAIPQLLELLDIEGDTVTIDAMGCQKDIAAAIIGKGADYVLAVKDNQPTLHEAIHEAFLDYAEQDYAVPSLRRYKTEERSHGRLETREHFIVNAPADLPDEQAWVGLKTIGMVLRTRQEGDKIAEEVAYYIGSIPAKVKRFAQVVRGHWGIENRLHWSLDVTFAEDRSRVRRDNGPENLALLRRLTLSLLQQDTSCKASLRGKRLIAGWNEAALLQILAAFSAK